MMKTTYSVETAEDLAAAEIASALHDMRAAYSRFVELANLYGIDPENAQNFAGFVILINNTHS